MPTELIRCPSCNAADTSSTDANGINQCVYCGVRYRLKGVHATPVMVVANPQSGGASPGMVAVVAAAGVMVMLLVGGVVAGMLFYGSSAEPPPPPPAPEVAAVTPTPAKTPAATPVKRARAPQVTPTGPLSAKFEYQRTITTSIGSQYVLGYVTNTSEVPVGKVKVNVVLLDGAGAELGVERGYVQRDVIAPGGRVPVKVLLKDPPDYKQLKYELVTRAPLGSIDYVEGLRIEAGEPRNDYGSSWKVDGKVFNDGDQAAQFVNIEAVAVDAKGTLLGVYSSYADAKRLEPGAASRFAILGVQLPEPPDHFEYSVVGRVAR